MKGYRADGKKLSSMAHAKRRHECKRCGKVIFGNGYQNHRRACTARWSAATVEERYEIIRRVRAEQSFKLARSL